MASWGRMNMKNLIVAAVVVAAATMSTSGSQPEARSQATAFVGVNVIPMDRQTVLRDQVVVVADGRIAALGAKGSVPIPAGAVQIS